jgi:hypothetical protein
VGSNLNKSKRQKHRSEELLVDPYPPGDPFHCDLRLLDALRLARELDRRGLIDCGGHHGKIEERRKQISSETI